ncbi:hypothetical protein P154DRAFT_172864 [Amniculicola lignicola CBS 123094]|uniref:Uncharacterized protein n=1 Tax=Amniculicola lignicola CBS 123094 TaxID=1392246 RepID=A0A6A5WU98_9PLEO|nr:hypothetical protein P154DRAFT_172864 [Amniculicola lignicola CBS 123094]
MSIARALTRRAKKPDAASASSLARSKTMKNPVPQIDRAKISGPVALVSTTNMLSYNAPDIATLRHASSSTSSTHSADDSDHSSSTARSRSSSHGSHDTMTDASSVESSPTSPAPNHLSGYFPPPTKIARRSASSNDLQEQKTESIEAIPAIPQRALSHSKRAHERLAHKRSLQTMPRASMHSNRSSREHRTSLDMFTSTIEEEVHPFGKELEQLNEVAEEFGGVVRDAEIDADMAAIRERGLAMFCAADYLAEIKPLFSATFDHPYQAAPMAWI